MKNSRMRSAKPFLLAAPMLFLTCGALLARAQSTSDPANSQTPATPQPPAASPASAAPAQTASSDSAAKPPAKPKHVFTNDDLPSRVSGTTAKDGTSIPGYGGLLECDQSCEHAAFNYLGYDSSNEAEWREQIVKARRDLAADNTWRGLLTQAMAQTKYYCNFLAQEAQKTAPSSNDYRARVQRSGNSEYFEYTERNLRASMEATMNQMQQRMEEVAVLSRVRSAMMYVQADRIWDRDCDAAGSH